MLLFSKKFLSLLLVMALVFEGKRRSAEGLMECWQCNGNGVDIGTPGCGAKHDGQSEFCYTPDHACAMIKDGDKITKKCEEDFTKWSDNGKPDGKPKCTKNVACYCNDADNCNRDMSFGLDGTGGGNGGGATDKSGSVGTNGMFPAVSILFWMMATVAVSLVPSI